MSRQTGQRVPNTAFVLSGGASLGALQVWMPRAVHSSVVELISLPGLTPRRYSDRLRSFEPLDRTAARAPWSAHRASIVPSRLALRLDKEPPRSAAFGRG